MRRLLALASAIPWAITPAWLSQIMAIANREGAGPEAVARELGRPLDNTHAVEMRGSVAVIPVTGPIFRRANMLSEVSGATSVATLARDFNAALTSEDVSAIVLDIDSPGGEVSGISEFSEMVYAARGQKPCVGYVGGDGASAAYWIASSCEHLIINDTASVGSIGVVRAVPNPAAGKAAEIEIVSSQSPDKRPDVLTKDGRAVYQAEVDALADIFIDRVARNRGTTVKAVLRDFGQGGCLVGATAVAAGMADGVGALESVIASFIPRSSKGRSAAAAKSTPKGTSSMPPTTSSSKNRTTAARRADDDDDAKGRRADDDDDGAKKGRRADDDDARRADDDDPDAKARRADDDDDARRADEDAKGRKGSRADDDDAPDADAGGAYDVGDAVKVGGVSGKVSEARNGPHYAIDCDDGSSMRWASEDEVEPADGSSADDDDDAPDADADPASPADSKAAALRAENRRLRAIIQRQTFAGHGNKIDALIAKAKADKKLTPALETAVRNLAKTSVPAAQAIVAALPRIPALANVRRPPQSPGINGATGTWNGKPYGELTMLEKQQLATQDPEVFKAMRNAHFVSLGEAPPPATREDGRG